MEDILNRQSDVPKASQPSWLVITLAGILLLTALFIVFIAIFLFTPIFASYRQTLFLRFNLLPVPVKLDNPRIQQAGVAYVFRGKITKVESTGSGARITTDIPELPPLLLNQAIQIYKGPDINSPIGNVQDLKEDKEIGISVVYDLREGIVYAIRIFMLK